MNLYRMSFVSQPMQAQTEYDILSVAVGHVDYRTEWEQASADFVSPGNLSVGISFYALNENEANRTAEETFSLIKHLGYGADSLHVRLVKENA